MWTLSTFLHIKGGADRPSDQSSSLRGGCWDVTMFMTMSQIQFSISIQISQSATLNIIVQYEISFEMDIDMTGLGYLIGWLWRANPLWYLLAQRCLVSKFYILPEGGKYILVLGVLLLFHKL